MDGWISQFPFLLVQVQMDPGESNPTKGYLVRSKSMAVMRTCSAAYAPGSASLRTAGSKATSSAPHDGLSDLGTTPVLAHACLWNGDGSVSQCDGLDDGWILMDALDAWALIVVIGYRLDDSKPGREPVDSKEGTPFQSRPMHRNGGVGPSISSNSPKSKRAMRWMD